LKDGWHVSPGKAHANELHELTALDISRFELTSALDCPAAVGLPSKWTVCVRPGGRSPR
jgi:hypothetical protein